MRISCWLRISAFGLVAAVAVDAGDLREYSGSYSYQVGENETLLSAKRVAMEEARRNASEKAGLAVVSITEVSGNTVAMDIIRSYCATNAILVSEQCSYRVDNDRLSIEAAATLSIDSEDLRLQTETLIGNEGLMSDLRRVTDENRLLQEEITKANTMLSVVAADSEAVQWLEKRNRFLKQRQANDLLSGAWIAMAGGSGRVLVKGTTTAEGRRKAKTALGQAINLDPENDDIRRTFGILQMEENDFDSAERSFQEAVRLNPLNGRNVYSMGLAQYNRGRFEEALKSFNHALEIDSSLYLASNMLGMTYYAKADYLRAAHYYYRTLNINPKYTSARFNLGICYYNLGDLPMARRTLNAFIHATDSAAPENTCFVQMADSLIQVMARP